VIQAVVKNTLNFITGNAIPENLSRHKEHKELQIKYRVIIIKVTISKCYKKSTTSQNDFKFGLNILEEGEFDMG